MTIANMSPEACCTCATIIRDSRGPSDPATAPLETKTEKQYPHPADRRLACCGRVICGKCIDANPRFASYCPYCQLSSSPSNPLPHGLREPPSYDTATSKDTPRPLSPKEKMDSTTVDDEQQHLPPPPYSSSSNNNTTALNEKQPSQPHPPEDTLHFLHPTHDTIPALSLRYNIPASVLRAHNNLTADHLLPARRTILIPGAYHPSGISLSPRPIEGEEEEARKAKIRRWMVRCKCAEYSVAELYLEQSGYELEEAVDNYLGDEAWERAHPLEGRAKGKGKAKYKEGNTGGTWASQAAFLRRMRPS